MDLEKRLKIREDSIAKIYRKLCSSHGYELAPSRLLPGDLLSDNDYVRKGFILINLDKESALTHPAALNFCEMSIDVLVSLPMPEYLGRFFSKRQHGDREFLRRLFPYYVTPDGYECLYPTYFLPITDTRKAVETIDKEVHFTASKLQPILVILDSEMRSDIE